MTTDNPTEPPYYKHNTGRIVRQTGPSSLQEVVTDLDLPIAMRFGPDGGLYVGLPALNEEARPGGILRVDVDKTGNGVTVPADVLNDLATTSCPELTPAMLAAAAPAPRQAPQRRLHLRRQPLLRRQPVQLTSRSISTSRRPGAVQPVALIRPPRQRPPRPSPTRERRPRVRSTINIAIDVETSAACPASVAPPTVSTALPTPTSTTTPASTPSAATPVAAASVVETIVPGRPLAIAIRNFAFDPPSVTIPAGTKVTWTNDDQIPHTATSSTDVFNSGNLALNQSYSYTFDKAGTFDYICIYHPYMKGTIIVE